MKYFSLIAFLLLWTNISFGNCVLLRSYSEIYYSNPAPAEEAWKTCSLAESNDLIKGFNSAPRLVQIQFSTGEISEVEYQRRLKQIPVNKAVMMKALFPGAQGEKVRESILQVSSTFYDKGNSSEITLTGRGALIAAVSKLPSPKKLDALEKAKYFVVTAGHLAKGKGLQIKNNLGEKLSTGRVWLDDEVDLAVVEVTKDPHTYPLAYFNTRLQNSRLAVYLAESALRESFLSENFSAGPQRIQEFYSRLAYPVLPVDFSLFQHYAYDISVLVGVKNDLKEIQSSIVAMETKKGSFDIKLGLHSGLSGTPLITTPRSHLMPTIGGIVTTSQKNMGEQTTTLTDSKRILNLLEKAKNSETTPASSEWFFINGTAIRATEESLEIFLQGKPIGKGVYVDGRIQNEEASRIIFKKDSRLEESEISKLRESLIKYPKPQNKEELLKSLKEIRKDIILR